jgi:hypothetical protein
MCLVWRPRIRPVLLPQPSVAQVHYGARQHRRIVERLSMYTVSVPVFIQQLNGLNTVLDKATAWAAAREVNENDLLNMRLSPDMFNLARQVRASRRRPGPAAPPPRLQLSF